MEYLQNAFEKFMNYHRKYAQIYEDVNRMSLKQQKRIENKIHGFRCRASNVLSSLKKVFYLLRNIESKKADLEGMVRTHQFQTFAFKLKL